MQDNVKSENIFQTSINGKILRDDILKLNVKDHAKDCFEYFSVDMVGGISRSTIKKMENHEMSKNDFFWQIFLRELYSFEI